MLLADPNRERACGSGIGLYRNLKMAAQSIFATSAPIGEKRRRNGNPNTVGDLEIPAMDERPSDATMVYDALNHASLSKRYKG